MSTPVDQVLLEARLQGFFPIAIFTPWGQPIGAGTEAAGCRAMQFFSGLMRGAEIESSPAALIYAEAGPVVLLAVKDEGAALSQVWGAFSRFGIEDAAWCAKWDGTSWSDLFPDRGAVRVLPEEIVLLPARFYQLEAELAHLKAQSAELAAGLETDREQFTSGIVIDTGLGNMGREARIAWVNERLQAVHAELSEWRGKLCGGQS